MKITCESCQAKYSIADEKVAGRVFKIRCKRCGEVIIVKGDEEPVQKDSAAQEPPVAADAVWHVVINGEQFGPYQPAQIGDLLATGQIDWEAYVWREGFDNWVPACDVDELVTAISGPQAEQQPAAAQASASDFTSVPTPGGIEQPTSIFDKAHASSVVQPGARPSVEPASMGADPFAEDAQGAGGVFDEPAADASADVFGGAAAASPFDGGDDYVSNEGVVASAASPRVSAASAMTGARNENSVLFSLKNLQALATGSSSGSMPPAAMATPGKSGLASGEGSGLIDIRALATAAGIAQADDQLADRDEILTMGSKTGAFGTLGSPMAPAAPVDESGRNKLVFAILGGAAFLAIAMIAVAFIFRGGPAESAAAVATVAPSPEVKSPTETTPERDEQQKVEEEKLSEGELAARAAAAQQEDDDKGDTGSRKNSSRRKRSRATSSSSGSSSNKSASAESPSKPSEPEPPVRKRSTGKESIDDLLTGALSPGARAAARKRSEPAEPSGPKLPSKPSRDDVLKALRRVQPAVQECAKGKSGVAMADIVVASSGRVKNVRVSRVTGPSASCIARAVRKARFPKFSSKEFSVSFPFRL